MMHGMKIFVIFVIFSLSFEPCFGKCGRSKYETDEGCCPKCEAGNHVHSHCSEDSTTSCTPCPQSTYTSEPNGLQQCTQCTTCNPAQGLKVKTACTQSSDAVCEPREGHYCTDRSTGGCVQATAHSKCHPGAYVKQKGTADRDTECDECGNGTYSDGSFQSCRPHSKCESSGRIEVKAGTRHSDTECVIYLSTGAIAGITVGVLVILAIIIGVLVAIILCLIKRYKNVQPTVKEVKVEPEQVKTEKVQFWWIKQVFLKWSFPKDFDDEVPPSIKKC